jgi:RES domain-containing protein
MEVFKIAREIFAHHLVASGRAHRWNLDEQFTIYTASSRSLASLELIVNCNVISPATKFKVMVISIADEENLFTQVLQTKLPASWRSMSAYPQLQRIGNDWYQSKASLILKVPSAVIPQEHNYVINTNHPEFYDKISLVRTEDYFWDERLF